MQGIRRWLASGQAAEITLERVQRALAERVAVAALIEERPGRLVERAVHRALDDAMAEAVEMLDRRLATITLADLKLPVTSGMYVQYTCSANLA